MARVPDDRLCNPCRVLSNGLVGVNSQSRLNNEWRGQEAKKCVQAGRNGREGGRKEGRCDAGLESVDKEKKLAGREEDAEGSRVTDGRKVRVVNCFFLKGLFNLLWWVHLVEESEGLCERKWEKRWEDAIIVEKIKVGVFSGG